MSSEKKKRKFEGTEEEEKHEKEPMEKKSKGEDAPEKMKMVDDESEHSSLKEEKKSEREQKTLDLLTQQLSCPVCFLLMEEKIYMCELGHCICEECREKLRSSSDAIRKFMFACPTCRTNSSFQLRNLPLEQLAAVQQVGCRFEGCEQTMELAQRFQHEKLCKYQFHDLESVNKLHYTESSLLKALHLKYVESMIGKQVSEWLMCVTIPDYDRIDCSNRFMKFNDTWVMCRFICHFKSCIKINVFHLGAYNDIWFKLETIPADFTFAGKACSLRGSKFDKLDRDEYGFNMAAKHVSCAYYENLCKNHLNCKGKAIRIRIYLFDNAKDFHFFMDQGKEQQQKAIQNWTVHSDSFATGTLDMSILKSV